MKTLFVLALTLGVAATAAAQPNLPSPEKSYSYDQRPGSKLPADLVFRDEQGRAVRLGDVIGTRPVLLALVQYRCPMLCNQVLNGLLDGLRDVPADAGDGFEVLVVSFDTREGAELAAAKRDKYAAEYGRPGATRGWHFWTGEQANIDALTDAVGFRYAYSKPQDRFAHPSGLVVLTPAGVVSSYLDGIGFPAKRIQAALDAATVGRVSPPVPLSRRVLLLCYDFDPVTGGLSMNVMKAVRAAGVVTVLGIGLGMVWSWRRERRAARA